MYTTRTITFYSTDTHFLFLFILQYFLSSPHLSNLQNPLNKPPPLTLQHLPNRITYLLRIGREDAGSVDDAVEDELGGDAAGEADGGGHGAVAVGDAVGFEGGGYCVL